MARRLYFVVHGGVVQCVGFRAFTQSKAQQYAISGWCRNTPDNKVEGEAQGEQAALDKFFQDVDQGPRHATVVQLTKEDRDLVQGESGFSIRH